MKNLKIIRSIIILSLLAITFLNINGQQTGKKSDFDLVFIGNSITQGVQLEKPQEESPPAFATARFGTLKGVSSAKEYGRL